MTITSDLLFSFSYLEEFTMVDVVGAKQPFQINFPGCPSVCLKVKFEINSYLARRLDAAESTYMFPPMLRCIFHT